jgi:hypothetical protein
MFDYFLTSFLLLALSIMMLALAWFGWKYSKKIFHVPVIVDLIFFFIFIKLFFYYLLPTVMRMASDYQYIREDNISFSNLITIYLIEFISWSIWIFVLVSILKIGSKNKTKISISQLIQNNYFQAKVILVTICFGFILTRIFMKLDIEFNLLLTIYKSLFFYTGLAAGPLLLVLSRKYFGNSFFLLGLFTTIISFYSISTRGALVYTIWFMIFLAWFVLKDRKSKVVNATIFFSVVLLFFYSGGLYQGSYYFDDSNELVINSKIGKEKKGARSVLDEIEWRYGASTRYGTSFIKLYERGKSAGINPIKHSFMGFLPRSMDPDKPHPSTLYGHNRYSQGMYIIVSEIHGGFNMVEFPTGAHFYWEFGIIGVLLLSAISGFYVSICAYFFSKLGIVSLPLIIAIFKPWGYVDPKIWVWDIVMQIYQIILPLILMFFIIKIVQSGFRILKNLKSNT